MLLDCNELIPDRLWVGSYIRPEDIRSLRQLGITSIICLQSNEDLSNYGIPLKKLLKAYALAQIEFRHIPTEDFNQQALAENLERGVAEIEAAMAPRWGKVYIHCTAGINRGPTLAAAYLIRSRGISAQEAYDFVVARRHCSPYLAVLEQYEESLKLLQDQ
jgi:protein-tyrosine phosphatase